MPPAGFESRNPNKRKAWDPRIRPRGHRYRHFAGFQHFCSFSLRYLAKLLTMFCKTVAGKHFPRAGQPEPLSVHPTLFCSWRYNLLDKLRVLVRILGVVLRHGSNFISQSACRKWDSRVSGRWIQYESHVILNSAEYSLEYKYECFRGPFHLQGSREGSRLVCYFGAYLPAYGAANPRKTPNRMVIQLRRVGAMSSPSAQRGL